MDELKITTYAYVTAPTFNLEGFYGKYDDTVFNISFDIKEEIISSLGDRGIDLDDYRNEDALESLTEEYDEDDIIDALNYLLTEDNIESFKLVKDRDYDYYGNEGLNYDVDVTLVFDKEQVIERIEAEQKAMETINKNKTTNSKGEER